MKATSARERRLVALLILIAAVAALWLGVLHPLLAGFTERASQREDLRQRYAANERLIARIPRLRRSAEVIERNRTAYGLAAPNAAQGGELLRERLETALGAAGGELRASEVLEGEEGWARAAVSATVSNQQMLAWLTALTGQPPYLAVESLTISADRATTSNSLDLMEVRLEATIPLLAPVRR